MTGERRIAYIVSMIYVSMIYVSMIYEPWVYRICEGGCKMAGLWWKWSEYAVPESVDIGNVYDGIASGLSGAGYTGVNHGADVHGSKGNFLVAVVFLFISNRNFWQIIAAGGGGSEAEAQGYLNEVQTIINNLRFL